MCVSVSDILTFESVSESDILTFESVSVSDIWTFQIIRIRTATYSHDKRSSTRFKSSFAILLKLINFWSWRRRR